MSFVRKATNALKGAGDTASGWVGNQRKQAQADNGVMKALSQGYGSISGKNYDYLIGDEFKFTGTVNAGGISYSGADIKIVVNIYNTQELQLQQWQQGIGEERERLDDSLEEAKLLKEYKAQVTESWKPATQEHDYAKNEFNKANQEYEGLKKQRESLDALEKDEVAKFSGRPPTLVLAEAQTLTISSFRDKAPVRSLGSVYPKGYTRGPRQIGGSIVFTVFDRDVMYDFLEAHPSDFDGNRNISAVLDQMPPVDIIISFASELGSVSRMALYGVEFVSQGQVMSIEDIITENTVEYVARDFDPMSHVGVSDLKKSTGQKRIWQSKSASDLIMEEDYQSVKGAVDPFERMRRRNGPFL